MDVGRLDQCGARTALGSCIYTHCLCGLFGAETGRVGSCACFLPAVTKELFSLVGGRLRLHLFCHHVLLFVVCSFYFLLRMRPSIVLHHWGRRLADFHHHLGCQCGVAQCSNYFFHPVGRHCQWVAFVAAIVLAIWIARQLQSLALGFHGRMDGVLRNHVVWINHSWLFDTGSMLPRLFRHCGPFAQLLAFVHQRWFYHHVDWHSKVFTFS